MKWPLAEAATGGSGDQRIPDSLLLDMRLMVPAPVVAPFHISSIGANNGILIITISGSDGVGAATAGLPSTGHGVSMAVSSSGSPAGVVLSSPSMVSALAGGLEGREWFYSPSELPLAPAACSVFTPSSILALSRGEARLTGDVTVDARNGMNFSMDGTAVVVSLYGEAPPVVPSVRRVNGNAIRHLWLAAKPDSELRVAGLKVTTRRHS